MSESIKILRELSDDILIQRHDERAKSTTVGTNHYLAELARRDQDKQTKAMLKYTWWITLMTGIMTISTIINIIIAYKATEN